MANNVQSFDPDKITLTNKAAARVQELITVENNRDLKLRVYITGGGCSGFQYGFTFDENTEDTDTIIENNQTYLVVDHMSYQYLAGSTIDYQENLEGSKFTVNNPNANTTCGCGSSFSI